MNTRSVIKEIIDPIIYQVFYTYIFLRANSEGELLIPVRVLASRFGVSESFAYSVLSELRNRGFITINKPEELPKGPANKRAERVIIKVLDYKERKDFLDECYPRTVWELAIDNNDNI